MLKDLDQRQVEQQGSSNFTAPVSPSLSSKKVIIISLFTILLLNAVGIFVWQLYTENQVLKASQTSSKSQADISKIKNQVSMSNSSKQATKNSNLVNASNVNNHKSISGNQNSIIDEKLAITDLNLSDKEAALETNFPSKPIPKSLTAKEAIDESTDSKVEAGTTLPNVLTEKSNKLPEPTPVEVKKSTLKISRKQLSPRELAKQKLKRAEQALDVNDVAKAETLFEDVLLVMPEHKSARKQLAALWFGRQSYADALNLLSQGIALAPNDNELRVMKARIYLQQNQIQQAFDILNNMPRANSTINIEYQSLRATTAQQLNEFSYATQAYKILVDIEPSAGRWWLGLAVALDSNSEFKQASTAYQTALNKTGLSGSAETFARQRIIELGE
jgi:MSHA biogenesis protein MshN